MQEADGDMVQAGTPAVAVEKERVEGELKDRREDAVLHGLSAFPPRALKLAPGSQYRARMSRS